MAFSATTRIDHNHLDNLAINPRQLDQSGPQKLPESTAADHLQAQTTEQQQQQDLHLQTTLILESRQDPSTVPHGTSGYELGNTRTCQTIFTAGNQNFNKTQTEFQQSPYPKSDKLGEDVADKPHMEPDTNVNGTVSISEISEVGNIITEVSVSGSYLNQKPKTTQFSNPQPKSKDVHTLESTLQIAQDVSNDQKVQCQDPPLQEAETQYQAPELQSSVKDSSPQKIQTRSRAQRIRAVTEPTKTHQPLPTVLSNEERNHYRTDKEAEASEEGEISARDYQSGNEMEKMSEINKAPHIIVGLPAPAWLKHNFITDDTPENQRDSSTGHLKTHLHGPSHTTGPLQTLVTGQQGQTKRQDKKGKSRLVSAKLT